MAEYIKREDALLKLMQDGCLASSIESIKNIPAADVAPVVHARWMPFHSDVAGDIQYCPACGVRFGAKTDYCPHCDARMNGSDDADAEKALAEGRV